MFELSGGWGVEPSNCFLNPSNTLSNYVLGVSYILYTYDLHHNFGRSPKVEKFNPQLIFHNSNTEGVTAYSCKLNVHVSGIERPTHRHAQRKDFMRKATGCLNEQVREENERVRTR